MTDLPRILSATMPLTLSGVPHGFTPVLLADLARAKALDKTPGRVCFVAPDAQTVDAIEQSVRYFAPELAVAHIPAWDCLPYDRASPSLRTASERLAGLHVLQAPLTGPTLVLTTINAVTQKTLTPFRIRQMVARLAPGERIAIERLVALLQSNGYVRTDTVHDAGEYAVRGGIVDLFPSGEDGPLRLDFFGDEIETLRRFDPATQRTSGAVDHFLLLPASEALLDEESIKRFRSRYRELFGATATGDPLYQAVSDGRRLAGMEHWLPLFEERLVPLAEHLPAGTLWLHDSGVAGAAEARFEAIRDYHANRMAAAGASPGSYRPLPPDRLYIAAEDWAAEETALPVHAISTFHQPDSATVLDFGVENARDFAPERAQSANIYEAVAKHLEQAQRKGRKRIIASYSVGARERLSGLLLDHGVKRLVPVDDWQQAQGEAAKGAIALTVLPLDHGFATADLELLTEQDMLGDRLVRRARRRKSADAFLAELATLTPGDLVVHIDHGIGRYEGLTSIPVGKAPHDCVALSYAGGDKLFVPVENIDVLSRYGSGEDAVALDRLGGEGWQRRKARMKERIREIAGELLSTAALRALRTAPAYEPETAGYPAFVDRFPYQETEDQDRAIGDVLDDLGAGKPMDRLVCGDVGFGKTEVALRAAFVAAMGGAQVALICPTTLLARQHHLNFEERFRGFPLKVGRLSRLVGTAETKATKAALADGTLDIVIGTHALLTKGLEFKRLGLVIVDEEQRFGVVHKERLKQLKADVHVLTLTATPIPRTLQMAMSGLRELSVIQTPPVDRLAVRTYIMPWDDVVLREALLREHYRGGQTYFVVPRISDMPDMEEFLREKVPEVRAISAHGQMSASEVEERMSNFYERKYDVLLSTTIVESGLDIPSANTIIIHRADRFGLAQLYQLRGRVGRSKTRAYAYMTTPADRITTETADKRLKVLSDLDTLGAGFQLASHDLDIRGAGNLVGDEQSGHIKEVGFELYQSMLEEAIMEAKAGGAALAPVTDKWSPQINVEAPILIPDDYVPDLDLRMGLYRRINELEDKGDIEGFAAEMIDRFGPLPDATQNLLTLIEVKMNCRKAGIAKIDIGPRGALVSFHNDQCPNLPGLLGYVQKLGPIAKLRPDSKLVIQRAWGDPKARLNGALKLSQGLAKSIG
ncbi:MAG TPA: transcription-repair coupling factor [Sphingobium sp.]|nr:transcription-repair coupling factor [Sphingobium sp.]